LFGGDEGSRTPVRKPIHTTFSGCSRSIGIPAENAGQQASPDGSFLMHDGYKSKLTVHGRCCMMPVRNGRDFPFGTFEGRSVPPTDRPHLGSQCYVIVSVYCLSWSFLRDSPALPAYRTAKSPSKPLRPHENRIYSGCLQMYSKIHIVFLDIFVWSIRTLQQRCTLPPAACAPA